MENKKLEKEDYLSLVKVIKKYSNLFKVLYQLDPAIASEFKKKQEAFYDNSHNHEHNHNNENERQSSCCGSLDNQSNYSLNIH